MAFNLKKKGGVKMALSTKSTNDVFYRVSVSINNNDLVEFDGCITCKIFEKYFLNNSQVSIVFYNIDKNKIDILLSQCGYGDAEICISNIVKDLAKESIIPQQNISYNIEAIEDKDIVSSSRSVHKLNKKWKDCEFSSIRAYLYGDCPKWLNKEPITNRFSSTKEYYDYLLEA